MSLRVISWVLDESEAKLGARLVLLALAEYAHDDGSKAFPSVETIARKARLSERGTRDALRKLEADGMIVHTGQTTSYGTRVYTVVCPFNTPADSAGGGSLAREGGQFGAEEVLQTAPDPSVDPLKSTPTPSIDVRRQVRRAWLDAPGMMQHRETYFADSKIERLTQNAIQKYGVDDVVAAIRNYAEVLASSEHFFSYRWTYGDFLGRGLDRFVPEAEPASVFRTERAGGAGLTPEEAATYGSAWGPGTDYATLAEAKAAVGEVVVGEVVSEWDSGDA